MPDTPDRNLSALENGHRVREPAVAGRFYPGERADLASQIDAFFNDVDAAGESDETIPSKGAIRALIAPHAGYLFSGLTAAHAFKLLQSATGESGCAQVPQFKRVVHIGPSHFVRFFGIATLSVDAVATLFGEIELDRDAIAQAMTLPFVEQFDQAHSREHGLEVHWPFLQSVFGDAFEVIPFVFSDSSGEQCARLIELLCKDEQTLVVVSSDLSHFHDYDTAQKMDHATCQAIEQLRPDQISNDQACGRFAVQGLLIHAAAQGWQVKTLDMRNSGDSHVPNADRSRVVGYGAWLFTDAED